MYKPLAIAAAVLASLMLSISSYAQRPSLGMYNSLKGIGAIMELPGGGDEFNAFTVFVEVFGIPTGRTGEPGVKFNYSHNFNLKLIERNSTKFSFYAGPGVSCGYLKDFEVGSRIGDNLALTKSHGAMLALSGTGGCRFLFNRVISLDISFTAELGVHLRRGEVVNGLNLSMYRNGLLQCFYPQASILFDL